MPMYRSLCTTLGTLALLTAAPLPAHAQPPDFPDVDSFPAVDPAPYEVRGAHPSGSGWAFSTPGGLWCAASMIPDLGVSCSGPIVGTEPPMNAVSVSLTRPGQFTDNGGKPEKPAQLVPTGSKFAPGNGVVCAVLADDELACRAKKPDSWPADTADPPDRHYGEHGFVMRPSGSWAY